MIRADLTGNEYGECTFSNGKKCEEWAYYRGECSSSLTGTVAISDVVTLTVAPQQVACE